MGDMEVKGNAALFDITNFDIKGPDKSSDSCYDVAQPGLGFNGSAWARFGMKTWQNDSVSVNDFPSPLLRELGKVLRSLIVNGLTNTNPAQHY